MKKIYIIAPNIKTGGGKELLEYMLEYLDNYYIDVNVLVYIDKTFKIDSTENRDVIVVDSKFKKFSLFFRKFKNVIYFGNLPPVRKSKNSIVYFHNLYLLMDLKQLFSNKNNKIINLIKVVLQQLYIRINVRNITFVASQNKNVKNSFIKKYHFNKVEVLPFYRTCPTVEINNVQEYDFCYISLAHPHKNHENLLDALEYLAKKKVAFSIALTIEKNKKELLQKIENINQLGYVHINNYGVVSKDKVCDIYGQSKCLIFPSKEESFGLSLVEAVENGLDVIASELDYVYEVIEPSLTFDPLNSIDIAGTIELYMNGNTKKSFRKTQNKIDDLINILLKEQK